MTKSLSENRPPDDVWDLFVKLSLRLVGLGFKKYSARAILHQIRWHYRVEMGIREFKCNNNWTPSMARRSMEEYPELRGFFETRASPGEWEDGLQSAAE